MLLIFGAVIGACIGSFLANLAVRHRQGQSGAVWGRSACPDCKTSLGVVDLIPIVSWIYLRGRCRHCDQPIDFFYAAVELTAALIGLVSVALLSPLEAGLAAILGWSLLLLAAIDIEEFLLPDKLTLPLLAVGLLLATIQHFGLLHARLPSLSDAAIGAGIGYGLFWAIAWSYRRLRGRDGLGLGDAKLLAAGLAWLGIGWLPFLILSSALMGIALAVVTGAWRKSDMPIPFGPPLAVTIWCAFILERVLSS